ncbi:dolichyl-phosphate-mannose-protein mannosyltransferase, partial [Coemansia sp. RSA 2599]
MTTRNVGPASRCLALLTEGLRRWLWPSRIKLQDGRCQRKHRHCHRRRHRVYAALLGLFLVALAARLRGIGADSRVVWDETHFGRFATRYINREFYLDVHPPLGKLLLTAIYAALGYSGDFDFESGQAYPSSVPIASARCVQALLGALLAPVSVVVLHAMRLPPACAWLAGFFAALDNALIGISRIVVLDSMLLLANALSLYAFLRLKLAQKRKLRHALVFGAALGILCSIKLVGLLTLTVFNAFLIGDILVYRGTPREHMRALLRLLSALALSALVYLAAFAIQLLVFQNYTPEAEHMGSEFVARLNNSAIASQYPTIRPGSFVVLRSAHYPFEYLSAYATNSNSSSDYVLATRRRLAVEDYWQ